ITDWSSIAQEFSYATKKPSLFINTPMKILNPEWEEIPIIPLDISLRDQIGLSVDPGDLDQLADLVAGLLADKAGYEDRISRLVSRNIFDVGDGARAGGAYIIQALENKRQERAQPSAPEEEEGPRDPLAEVQARLAHLSDPSPRLDKLLDQPLEDLDPDIRTHGQYLVWLIDQLQEQSGQEEETK
ncbi:MAG: hypothetical protein GX849_01340, partial [Clostridiaceae bacterium]|nr:hypothetical protein [Clostridiaceae bacterium]